MGNYSPSPIPQFPNRTNALSIIRAVSLDKSPYNVYIDIMDCSKCASWNRGRGKPACLKCKQYKDLQLKSVKRQSIKTEHVPDAILENIADPRIRDLMDIIKKLPLQYAVPLMMRATLGASLQEIADYHHCTRSAIQRITAKGCKMIQESLRDG